MGLCVGKSSSILVPSTFHADGGRGAGKEVDHIHVVVPVNPNAGNNSFSDMRESTSSKRDDSDASATSKDKRRSQLSSQQISESSPIESPERKPKKKKGSKLFSSSSSPNDTSSNANADDNFNLNNSPGSPSRKAINPLRKLGSKVGNILNHNEGDQGPIPSSPLKVSITSNSVTPKSPKKSLLPNDVGVIQARKKWMEEEKAKMADTMAQEWEAIFKDMAHEQGKNELTKQELMEAFTKMGKRIDEEMINKVFVLFDANGDGVVDLTEFMVAMLFLSYRGSAKDNVELAFRLFDTNRSGDVSKREFSEMISSIIGTSVPTLLNISEAEKLFRKHLEQEFAIESLDFIDELESLKKRYPPSTGNSAKGLIPITEAKALIEKYILEGSPEQVNVSEKLRISVKSNLDEAVQSGSSAMSWKSFLDAEEEIIGLLERDKLPRFKKRIRNSTTFADSVWKTIGLNDEDGMSVEQFRSWSATHPGIFSFLDEMQKAIIDEETRKAAALKIQRAHRRAQHRRGKTNISLQTDRFSMASNSRMSQFEGTGYGKLGTMSVMVKQDSVMSIFRVNSTVAPRGSES